MVIEENTLSGFTTTYYWTSYVILYIVASDIPHLASMFEVSVFILKCTRPFAPCLGVNHRKMRAHVAHGSMWNCPCIVPSHNTDSRSRERILGYHHLRDRVDRTISEHQSLDSNVIVFKCLFAILPAIQQTP